MSMPTEIVDEYGGSFHIGDAGSVWFPPFPLKNSYVSQLQVIMDTQIKDDDVIMLGYGKSGSTWHFEILTMLQQGSTEYVRHGKPSQMIDRLSPQELNDIPSPRVLNTHLPFKYLPKQALEKKTKMILLLRNPKDVCVSMYNHMNDWVHGGYNGTWDSFVNMFLDTGAWYGHWFTCMKKWEEDMRKNPDVPIFISTYEAMIKDPVEQTYRLSQFLGKQHTRDFCYDVAHKCSFQNLKEASDTVKDDHFPPGSWKDGAAGFFRKGIIGDWKNWFTDEQNRKFDLMYHKYMTGTELDIVFE